MPVSVLIFFAVFSVFYLFLAGYLLLHELFPRGRGDRRSSTKLL